MRHSTWEDEEDWEYTALPSLCSEEIEYTTPPHISEALTYSPLTSPAAASMAIFLILSGFAQMLSPTTD